MTRSSLFPVSALAFAAASLLPALAAACPSAAHACSNSCPISGSAGAIGFGLLVGMASVVVESVVRRKS